MSWPSISAARSPISSPTITRTNQVRYTKSPTTYGNLVDGIFECFDKVELEPQRSRLRQSRHDAGDQRADPAQGRARRRWSRPPASATCSRSRAATARTLRSALPARRAADPARAALRGPRAHRRAGRGSSSRSTRPALERSPPALREERRRGGRDLLHELLRQPGARRAGRRDRCASVCLRRYVTTRPS